MEDKLKEVEKAITEAQSQACEAWYADDLLTLGCIENILSELIQQREELINQINSLC